MGPFSSRNAWMDRLTDKSTGQDRPAMTGIKCKMYGGGLSMKTELSEG